ncbi:MAG: YdiU family protein [Leptospiraceae bacterium]|nr:YdiU family protein [Leptospiraceae bacterium]
MLKNPPPFVSRYLDALPVDNEDAPVSRQVSGVCASRAQMRGFSDPQLIAWNPDLAGSLSLQDLFTNPGVAANVLCGNQLLPGMRPYAMRYGGHQFGHWAGQLGDGRAINLGELPDQRGRMQGLQLKGAGPTAYSRQGDGLAVLRSSLREYLCSAAMIALQIPSTRALSLVLTGEQVVRDMFYDGNPKLESGAVVCRVSESFIRFGHFELLAARHEFPLQRQLADFVIANHYAHIDQDPARRYQAWFHEICACSLQLVLDWQRVGFVHGVLNTDNMSILGETIDYGPYGWLEDYDPLWTPNTTDAAGRRYSFGNQPAIVHWNLAMLANALYQLIADRDFLEAEIAQFESDFQVRMTGLQLAKTGFCNWPWNAGEWQQLLQHAPVEEWVAFVLQTEELLKSRSTDYTIFYDLLADFNIGAAFGAGLDSAPDLAALHRHLADAFYDSDVDTATYNSRLQKWAETYARLSRRIGLEQPLRKRRMRQCNPRYVLRNYMAQEAIDLAETGDYSRIAELFQLLQKPYADQPAMHNRYCKKRPAWANSKPGCAMLSCSS